MTEQPMNTQQAFTLIEVIMVIAIIAILAALALPSQIGQITQKRLVETLDLVEPYKPLIAGMYVLNGGQFPANNEAAGLPDADKVLGNYLEKVELVDGAMHLHLGQKLPNNLHGKILSIQPVFVRDSIDSPVSWVCGYNEVPDGMEAAGTNRTDIEKLFLPGRCR